MIRLFSATETNFTHDGVEVLDDIVISSVTNWNENSKWVIEAKFKKDFDKSEEIKNGMILKVSTEKGEQLFQILKTNKKNRKFITVYGHAIGHSFNDNFIQDINIVEKSGRAAIQQISSGAVENHRYNLSSNIDTVSSTRMVRKNGIDALLGDKDNSFRSRWGGYLVLDNFNISMNSCVGTDKGVEVAIGKNVLQYDGTIDETSVVTGINAITYDGITLPEGIYYSPLADKYPNKKIKEFKFDKIKYKYSNNNTNQEGYETLEEVYSAIRKACDDLYNLSNIDKPTCSLRVDIAALEHADQYKGDELNERIFQGDILTANLDDYGFDVKLKMVANRYDNINNKYIDIDLGDAKANALNSIGKVENIIDQVVDQLGGNTWQDILDKAMEDASQLIAEGIKDSYVVARKNEILIMDSPDVKSAKNVIRMNRNGIAFSQNGYNGPYTLAITIDGKINASCIMTGELNAALIKVGILQSANAKTWINMENGTFSFADGKIRFDGNKVEVEALTEFKKQESESGNANLIVNSLGKNGEKGWVWFNYKGQNFTHSITCQNDEWTGYEDALRIGAIESNSDTDQGYVQKIKVVPGKKYVFRAMVGGHRSAKRIVFTNEGNDKYITNSWTGGHMNGFEEVILKFTATERFVNLRIGFDGNEGNGIIWLKEPCLIEGEIPNRWLPHISEIYEGITSINDEGVKVSMSNGEGLQGYSKTTYDGFSIYDSNGVRKAWFGDGNSAYIQSLSADTITNRHLVKWAENRPSDVYIAPSSTGDGTGRDGNNKSNSINHTLEWIKQTYGCYSYKKNLNIHVDNGTYYEDIYIGGWLGSGVIQVYLDNGATFYGNHRIEENSMYVYFNGRRWNDGQWINEGCLFIKKNSEEALFHVRNSNCHIYNLRACKEGWSGDTNTWLGYGNTFIFATSGANVFCYNNDVVGFYYFVRSHDNSQISIYKNRGHCNDLVFASLGGVVKCQDATPLYVTLAVVQQASDFVDKGHSKHNSMFQTKPEPEQPPYIPPTTSWQWFEQSFTLSNLRTRPEGGGSSTSSRNGEWGQGSWGGYQSHRGYADLGNDPEAWANGGRNFTVELTLTRSNTSHGYTGATPQPKIKLPNGSYWNCGVGFARGQTSTVTLPSELAGAIASGSVKTLEMWSGSSNNDYSFYNYSSIKIKCEKEV